MKKLLVALLVAASFAMAPAAGPVRSGLKPGSEVTPFHLQHVTGPLAGTDKCFPCTYRNRPQVQVWINGDDMDNVAALAKALDDAMGKYERNELKVLFVLLVPPYQEATVRAAAEATAKKHSLQRVSMAVLPVDADAVKAYEIETKPEVKNTVITYAMLKVRHNMVNLKADEKGLARLNDALAELVKAAK